MPECPVCRSAARHRFATAFDRFLGRTLPRWDILRCRGCGMGWTSPPLPREEIASHYPDAYLGDTEKALEEFLQGELQGSRSWRRETEKVRLVERFIAGGRLLDAGCGDGKFLWALDPARWQRSGVERDRGTVELVSAKIRDLELLAGDLYSAALDGRRFDAITFWHVLEHLPDPGLVLDRVHRLLNPRGWLFISLPNLASLQARVFRRHWYPFDDVPRHLYHFSPRPLEILLRHSGFELERHLPFSPLVNMHSLKYSLINWSEEKTGGRQAYYLLKPLLFPFHWLERITGRPGILTTVARKA